ncbi:MAG TPA: hypothetical protein VF294_10300, partial [Polyangiaceae bacterium]
MQYKRTRSAAHLDRGLPRGSLPCEGASKLHFEIGSNPYELNRDMSHYLLNAEPGASPSVGDLIAGKYRLDSIIG